MRPDYTEYDIKHISVALFHIVLSLGLLYLIAMGKLEQLTGVLGMVMVFALIYHSVALIMMIKSGWT